MPGLYPRLPRIRGNGFTLLETLVVMALLSIIMLAMVSALRGVAQGGERIDARFQRLDDYRVAMQFMRGALGRLSARQVTNARGGGPLFVGASDHVAWVGVMPARYGVGGRHFFRLGVETIEGVPSLALRYLPWVDQSDFPDWSSAALQVLIPGVESVAMRYEDPRQPDAAAAWTVAWSFIDELPSTIAIVMQGEHLLVDRMVLPLRVLPASDPRGMGGDGTVVGGS